jgi:L-alanine-DL-glutamate epimerase-like enolase superfamily enzyme
MITVSCAIEHWAMTEPFEISREVITHQPVLLVTLRDAEGRTGQAEAAGVDYDGETPTTHGSAVAACCRTCTTASPAPSCCAAARGRARNALDCACGTCAPSKAACRWRAAGCPSCSQSPPPSPGPGRREATTRRKARGAPLPLLKLKVDAQRHLEVVRWVREEHPRARIVVDANQAWSLAQLQELLPALAKAGVELVEQPLARGQDAGLLGFASPIPLAADESCTDRSSLAHLLGRYQYINIKLDKCGGLTEALALAAQAQALGFGLMVGNMCGTSLAMAPAFLLAQQCRYVDLDGPLLQTEDRLHALHYQGAEITPPSPALWG